MTWRWFFLGAFVISATTSILAYARSAGPPPGHSGADVSPGVKEPVCTRCHAVPASRNTPAGMAGSVSIGALPAYYCPDRTYSLTVTTANADASRRRWGFQLTAIRASNNAQGGTLALTDASHTRLYTAGVDDVAGTSAQAPAGRRYVEQRRDTPGVDGTFPGQAEGATWGFNWIAPPAGSGTVNFFAAGNAADNRGGLGPLANGTGNNTGDWIYTTSATLGEDPVPPSVVASDPIALWPPNHRMVRIGVSDLVAAAGDNCDAGVSPAGVRIVAVENDETGADDAEIANDGRSVQVRAERDGNGDGREYTVTLQITDASGNIGTAHATVVVAHDQGN